ncbi:hypothetical protein TNCV_3226651 [Trichonephila clavipes]|nr:hypothetical protein TNCV_3226651 [Trichonephila clavipes]
MDRLKFELAIVKALSASPPTNKRILTDDEDNSVVIPLARRSKRYNPPFIHVMAFTWPFQDKRLSMTICFDVLMIFLSLTSADF